MITYATPLRLKIESYVPSLRTRGCNHYVHLKLTLRMYVGLHDIRSKTTSGPSPQVLYWFSRVCFAPLRYMPLRKYAAKTSKRCEAICSFFTQIDSLDRSMR